MSASPNFEVHKPPGDGEIRSSDKFRLVTEGLNGPFFDQNDIPAEELEYLRTFIPENLDRWPDFKFDFNDAHMIGTGVVTATRASRIRGVVEATHERMGLAFGTVFSMSEKSVFNALKNVEKYLAGSATFGEIKMTRNEMLPESHVLSIVEEMWRESNHPLMQALWQVSEKYDNEDGLSRGEIKSLARDVMISTQQLVIVDIYSEFKQELRKLINLQSKAPA